MRSIIVVDDDKDILYMVKLALEKNGFKVAAFRKGHEVLKVLKTNVPDLMIVDLSMPEIDGWRLCMKIREDEKCKDFPIIVLSGLVAEEVSEPTLNEPYNLLMAKPFEIEKLIAKVKELLKV